MRYISYIILFILGSSACAQNVQVGKPWILNSSFNLVGDTLCSIGMGYVDSGSQAHRIRITRQTKGGSFYETRLVNFMDDYACEIQGSGATITHDSMIVIACQSKDSFGIRSAYLWRLDYHLNPIDTFFYTVGYNRQAISLSYDSALGRYLVLGDYVDNETSPRRSYLLEVDTGFSEKRISTYGCKDYPGCNYFSRQVIPLPKGKKLIVGLKVAPATINLNEPKIFILDSNNKVEFKLAVEDDTFCLFDIMVGQISDSQFVAVTCNSAYKPYKKDSNNPNALTNYNRSYLLVPFDVQGNVDKPINLDSELRFKLQDQDYRCVPNKIIQTRDGGLAVAGETDYITSFGAHVGFLLKLDSNANFEWFRKYPLNISTPFDDGQVLSVLYDVYQNEDHTYVLTGEYFTASCDSFPKGAQLGMLLFVDQYGCLEPGCEQKDYIKGIKKRRNPVFTVFPNPSSGNLTIRGKDGIRPQKVEIFNAVGKIIYESGYPPVMKLSIHLPGVYFVRITPQNLITETHKILVR